MTAYPVYPHQNGAPAHDNNSNSNNNNTNGSNNTRYGQPSEPAELTGSDMPVELPAGPDITFFVPPPPPHLPKVVNNEPAELPEDTAIPPAQSSSSITTSFPPPPPGPPPASTSASTGGQNQHTEQQEAYQYPPPPPGPPPNHAHAHNIHAHTAAEDEGASTTKITGPGPGPDYNDDDIPPPSYEEEFGAGPSPAVVVADAKFPPPPPGPPPMLPPRPVSASGSSMQQQQQFPPPPVSPSPAQQKPQFPPPPLSPSLAAQGGSSSGGGENGSGGRSGHGNGGFGEKLYHWGVKAGMPVNRLANRFGSEAFWPMTMDLECDKAARILKSFCQDGFYTTDHSHKQQAVAASQSTSSSNMPIHERAGLSKSTAKVLVKIPASVIAGAKGLAIFTTFRTGLHISGAGGSGVVVARLPDGSWSPPAGFLVHTLGAGFMVGIDVYDCVCVLTTRAAVDAFARRARVSLGGEIAVVAGPVGVGGVVEGVVGGSGGSMGKAAGQQQQQQQQQQKVKDNENGNATNVSHNSTGTGTGGAGNTDISGENCKPIWSYMKSRGLYAGVQADGTVIIPRADANAAFYGERNITVEKILKGQVPVNNHQQQHQAGRQERKDKHKDKEKENERDLVMWPEGGRRLVEALKSAEDKRADADARPVMVYEPT